jgi:hypothetical protein
MIVCHFQEIAVPVVEEDITCISVDAEHPNDCTIPFNVEGVITRKRIGVCLGGGAG